MRKSSRLLKSESQMPLRGTAGDKESRSCHTFRARFLAPLGMTRAGMVLQQPASTSVPSGGFGDEDIAARTLCWRYGLSISFDKTLSPLLLVLILMVGNSAGRAQAGSGGLLKDSSQMPPVSSATAARPRSHVEQPSRLLGRRDPFQLPTPPATPREIRPRSAPPPGKRGLTVGKLRLLGIVRAEGREAGGRMIAVVTDFGLTYFLRENDPLYDGRVKRISADSVCLEERYVDREGQWRTREVVKRLGETSEEGK